MRCGSCTIAPRICATDIVDATPTSKVEPFQKGCRVNLCDSSLRWLGGPSRCGSTASPPYAVQVSRPRRCSPTTTSSRCCRPRCGAGTADRRSRLRAVRPAAARGPPLRRGRGHRPAARRAGGLPLRRGRARLPPRARRRRRGHARSGWPTTGSPATSGATPRARSTSRLPVLSVEGSFAECVLLETLVLLDPQPRLRDRRGRVPDDLGRRRPAAASRWAPAARTSWRRSPPPARPTSAASPPRPTSTPAPLRHPDGRHERPRLHAAARHRAGRLPGAGRRARAGHHAAGRHLRRHRGGSGPPSRSPGPSWAAVRIDSGDLLPSPHQVRQQLDDLGATTTRIIVTCDLDEHAIAALAAAPVDGVRRRHRARHRVRAPDQRLRLQAGRPRRGRRRRRWCRWRRRASDKMSIGGRKWALRRRTRRHCGGRGDRHRADPVATATTGSCWSSWCATASGVPGAARRRPGPAPYRRSPSCR